MAKIKTTVHEDQLSVIAQEIRQAHEIVRDLESSISSMTQNQTVYQKILESERIESLKMAKAVISQEISSLNNISRDILSLEQRVNENIQKATLKSLQEVKDAVLVKNKTSKQMIWMLGICGILVALVTMALLVSRSFDKSTITGAMEEKAKYESLMLDLKQWAKENPKDAKSFNQWEKDNGRR